MNLSLPMTLFKALKEEAKKHKISVSAYSAHILSKEMSKLGK